MYGFIPIPIINNNLIEHTFYEKLQIAGAVIIAFIGLFIISKIITFTAKSIMKIKNDRHK